jgi:hypothetical protein
LDIFAITNVVAWLAVVAGAWIWRSRAYAVFVGVVLGLPTWVGVALRPHLGLLGVAIPVLTWALTLHLCLLLVRPRMLPAWANATVSVPGLWFAACSFLALPWAVAAGVGLPPYGAWLPFLLGGLGLAQSLHGREETVDVVLDGRAVTGLSRHAAGVLGRGAQRPAKRPLRIVQISDPHLGPFMSVARLRRICRRAVLRDPDLVLLTGDLMTMQSHDEDLVAAALEPLRALSGRVFACHGNHDLEARRVVAGALARNGIRLLVDEVAEVSTEAGRVQILGADFRWRDRAAHLQALCEQVPRRAGMLRLMLLHDPGAFRHMPADGADLVLSGHTHGGQVGLVSLGLPHTFLSLVSSIPDHGLWARGRDRLYVHRATGHYGFPIRLGVPSEQSLMRVWST